jgi:NCS2 family nucleobase:cation symporter-2
MKRPSNLIYSVEEEPPTLVCLISGLQHLAILAPNLILAILVMRASGGTVEAVAGIVSLSMVAYGIGAILLSMNHRWIGSGYAVFKV